MKLPVFITLLLSSIAVLMNGCDDSGRSARMILGLKSHMSFEEAQRELAIRELQLTRITKEANLSRQTEDLSIVDARVTGFAEASDAEMFATFYGNKLMKVWVRAPSKTKIPSSLLAEFSEFGIVTLDSDIRIRRGQLEVTVERGSDRYINLLVTDRALSDTIWEQQF